MTPESNSQFHDKATLADFSEKTAAEIKEKIESNKVPRPPKENVVDTTTKTNGQAEKQDEKQQEKSLRPDPAEKRQNGEETPKEKKYERPSIAKIIETGSPVLPDDIETELESIGAWFLKEELDDDDEMDVRIIYKNPSGGVEGDMLVTWEEITPQYETAEEYSRGLEAIIQAYHQAKEDNNEVYQYHLAQLALQVRHFAQKFYNKKKRELESQAN